MNILFKIVFINLLIFFLCKQSIAAPVILNDSTPLLLSGALLYHVKMQEPTAELEQRLAKLSKKQLQKALPDDDAKKTFWLNIYNASFQLLAAKSNKNPDIFNKRLVVVAGLSFSLEEIEQGILRKDYKKLEAIYKSANFSRKKIRFFTIDKVDHRIHFALNCGAKSCPPIAFYNYENINRQLDAATRVFLTGATTINESTKEIITTQLMEWYKDDFNGDDGIRQIIKTVLGKDVTGYSIRYSEYNWKEDLRNFQKEE